VKPKNYRHPWRKNLFMWRRGKDEPRKVVLPAEDVSVLTNGEHKSIQAVQEAPGGDLEKVLVFPSSLFNEGRETTLRPFTGFRTDAPEMAGRLFPHGVSSGDFLARTRPPVPGNLESDRRWKQVVACVVPWHAPSRQVWTFRRGSSEGRLDGKVSCLIGGHVNLHDAYPPDLTDGRVGLIPDPDLLDVTFAAVLREMGEEMAGWEQNWKSQHSDCRLVLMGVVHDDSDDVGAVHFGFIYRLDVARLEFLNPGPNALMRFAREAGEASGWADVDHLADGRHVMGDSRLETPREILLGSVETWTGHVARHLSETSPARHAG
jgi:predicted NUDIX family phosphoesterase